MRFNRNRDGQLDLTREAAHSVRRIYHATDRTGEAIQSALIEKLRSLRSVTVYDSHTAIDLITNVRNSRNPQDVYRNTAVVGAYVLDERAARVAVFLSPAVILATGGVGNLYLHTSNPPGATGDGIAMAHRIGARILHAEYVQFHPTILHHLEVKRFLITEALRGEGARLMNGAGEYFMERYSPELGDLAPRDEVARAIYREMETENSDYVRLDAGGITELSLETRFPAIFERCAQIGIDIRREPIPVVPAAHYFCGGVQVETACTGVHGANRLASVSLLEGLYWGVRTGTEVAVSRSRLDPELAGNIMDWAEPRDVEQLDPILVNQDMRTIQSTMWNYAGIIRSRKRLLRAQADLAYLSHRIEQFYQRARLTRRIIELRNSVVTAGLIVKAALANPVSCGCHYVEEETIS